jgi:bifunctional UDP-N-acetylglucosamine pyrophosphorylase / glucosamine-1-phosphate N-acetyltransferase
MNFSVVILAAGQGKRMYSDLPKVLHPLAGKPLLAHVLQTVELLKPSQILCVYGHGGTQVREAFSEKSISWVHQTEQKGTGHAVAQTLPHIPDDHQVLVLYGDVPLIQTETLQNLINLSNDQNIAILTVTLENPTGYGRIIRDERNEIVQIVEEKDATKKQRQIKEGNSGILIAPALKLKTWLNNLKPNNAQGEYYLTDIIGMAVQENISILSAQPVDSEEVFGINARLQLAYLERYFQKKQAEQLMRKGVTLIDPNRLDVRGNVDMGRDVLIDANVIFEGTIKIGNRVKIGAFCHFKDVSIGDDVEILPYSIFESVTIEKNCKIGPFSRLRPETHLSENVHIGNFVELKKTTVAKNSKINHLSYVGDAQIGCDVNIGAGTITCNYDGANKHQTIIEDRVFVGSDTQLVAPVTIAEGTTIGAGSTITKDTQPNSLTLSRSPQKSIANWQRPVKKK